MTLLSRCLCSFCTDGLVDIIAGLSAGFSLSQRLVDFRKTSYAKYTVPTSFCKAVGQIGHALGTIQSSFFFTFFYLYFTLFTVQCYRNLYIYTQIFFFFNQNWLQCDVCLRRWSNLCTYDGQFPWSGRQLCGILPALLEQQIAHCDMI